MGFLPINFLPLEGTTQVNLWSISLWSLSGQSLSLVNFFLSGQSLSLWSPSGQSLVSLWSISLFLVSLWSISCLSLSDQLKRHVAQLDESHQAEEGEHALDGIRLPEETQAEPHMLSQAQQGWPPLGKVAAAGPGSEDQITVQQLLSTLVLLQGTMLKLQESHNNLLAERELSKSWPDLSFSMSGMFLGHCSRAQPLCARPTTWRPSGWQRCRRV